MGETHVSLDLASRLNASRRRRRMSVRRLARVCGISRSHVHELLTGKRIASPAIAERLIDALELDEAMAAELRALPAQRYISVFGSSELRLDRQDPPDSPKS